MKLACSWYAKLYVLFYLFFLLCKCYLFAILTAGCRSINYFKGVFLVSKFLLLFKLQQNSRNLLNTPQTKVTGGHRKNALFASYIANKRAPRTLGGSPETAWSSYLAFLYCYRLCLWSFISFDKGIMWNQESFEDPIQCELGIGQFWPKKSCL